MMGVLARSARIKPTVRWTSMSRDWGDQCSGVILSSFVITKSWRLKDHSRWVFRKNLIEFLIGLTTYLYYFYKWLYTTSPWSHVFLECSTITCPCHVIWLLKFPYYLYLGCIVWLDVCDQVFERVGNLFLLGALITESYLGISYNVEQDTVTWVNTTKDLSLLQTQHAHAVKQLRHKSISSSHAPPMKNTALSYAKHHKHYIYLTSLAPRMAYKPWHPS